MNRILSFLRTAIQPHPSVTNTDENRRAQLLAILSLIQLIFVTLGLLSRPGTYGVFILLGVIAILCYVSSRTRYHKVGAYILSYFITSIAYVRIYQGTTDSVDLAVSASVHLSLVLASALLSSNGFLVLAIASTAGVMLAPLYSNVPPNNLDSIG